jgi:hypothetical protein
MGIRFKVITIGRYLMRYISLLLIARLQQTKPILSR